MKKFDLRFSIVWVFFSLFLFAQPAAAKTAEIQAPCRTYETVFSRGSGSSGPQDDTSNSFLKNLQTGLGVNSNDLLHHYDLGTESYNNYQYPHVGIIGNLSNDINGLGAVVSSGESFTYGKSVDAGVGELTAYLQQRINKCPDAKYIIGGYSQGAQVVVNTLPSLTKSERDKITYVALFGNPKLYLPEAHSYDSYQKDPQARGNPLPDSCYGDKLSPWHNVIEDCTTFSGKLYSEKSYIPYPSDIQARVHEWCFDEDGICDGEKEPWGAGHTKYPTNEGVPRAVNEALYASGQSPKLSFIDLTNTSKRYDVLFEIPMHCTPLFRFEVAPPTLVIPYQIHYMYRFSKQVLDVGEYIYDSDYTGYEDNVRAYIASLWRENSEHIHYRISPLSCEDQYISHNTISRQSLVSTPKAQKLNISSSSPQAAIEPIIDYSNATVISDIPDDPVCLTAPNCHIIDATTNVITQPTPIYPVIKNVTNLVNQTVTYSLSQAIPLSMYDTYLWDVNGDGYADITTTEPTLVYAYRSSYTGPLHVTATSSMNGLFASTDFNVTILSSYHAPARPLALLGLTVKKLPNDSVSVSWARDSSDTVTAGWLLSVNDFPIAKTTLSTTQITITDMHFEENKPITIAVAGLTGVGLEGAQTSVTILPTQPDNVVVGANDTKTSPVKQKVSAPFDINQPSATHQSLLYPTDTRADIGLSPANVTPQSSVLGDETHATPATHSSTSLWTAAIAAVIIILGTIGYIKLRK